MKLTYKTVNAEDIFPVAGVFDGVVVGKRGALTLGWELTLPHAFSADEKDYDDLLEAFASAVRVLPPWTVLHRQDLYTEHQWTPGAEAPSFLGRAYDRHFEGRRYLRHSAYVYLTFGTKNLLSKSGSGSGLFGIIPNSVLPDPSAFAAFRAKCREFQTILCTGGRLVLRELTDSDWLGDGHSAGLIQRVMMLGEDSPVMHHVAMSPAQVQVGPRTAVAYTLCESDHLPNELGTASEVESLSIGSAGTKVFLSGASCVGVLLPCEHMVNQYIVVPAQDEVLRDLDKERKKMFSGASSTDNRINGTEIASFLDDVYKNGLLTVKAHTNVIAWGPDSEVEAIAGIVSAALSTMGVQKMTSVRDNFDTPLIWYAAIPGNASDLGKENLMTMELRSALCLGTYETFDEGIEGGVMRICDRQRHVPLRMDTQREAQRLGYIGNFNVFALGSSGSGKSFFTNMYLRNCYDAGEHCFVIDVGGSYEGLCGVIHEESGGVDGQYLSWDTDHQLSFNPFIGWREWLGEDGTLQTDDPGVNCLLGFIQTAWVPAGGWAADRKTILTGIVVDFLRACAAPGGEWSREGKEGDPVFDDLYRFVEKTVHPRVAYKADDADARGRKRLGQDIEDDYRANGYWIGSIRVDRELFDTRAFLLSLKQYARGGSYGTLLNDPAPRDLFASRFTVVDVEHLSADDKTFYSLCILFIMNAFERKMRGTPEFKIMCIDEAWKAIANETMAPYMASLWKTIRKFSGSAMVITQEVADIIHSPVIKTAILENSDVKILLDQSSHMNNFDGIVEMLSLSEKEKSLVLSINRANDARYRYKEVFIKLGALYSGVYATEVSPEEAKAYESDKNKKRAFLQLAEKAGSYIEATQVLQAKQRRAD